MAVWIQPRPFFIPGGIKRPLTTSQNFTVLGQVPYGSDFVLWYVLAAYPRTVVAGAQTTPEVFFRLKDSQNKAYDGNPIFAPHFTSPVAYGRGLQAVQPIQVKWGGGDTIMLEVTGQNATDPREISVTFYGMLFPQVQAGFPGLMT